MRRKDREVTDFKEIIAMVRRCDVCRLGFIDDGLPYILPLNFGMEVKEGQLFLYFHSAKAGHKLSLIQKNSRVSFEMDSGHALSYQPETGNCSFYYESIMGYGQLYVVEEGEKAHAMELLMDHYHPEEKAYFNRRALPALLVYGLAVDQLTAKRHGE